MEEYIGTVIKAGGIVIGCVMVLFVIWYIVKDILDISEKDSSDGQIDEAPSKRHLIIAGSQEISTGRRYRRHCFHRVRTVHIGGELTDRDIFIHIHKFGELALETKTDISNRTVTMFGNNNLRQADQGISTLVFRYLIIFGTMDETNLSASCSIAPDSRKSASCGRFPSTP